MSEDEAKALLFGHLRISVNADAGRKVHELLNMQLSYKELAAWLKENRSALLEEEIPTGESGSSGIAEAVARYYEELDPDNEDLALDNRLYAYRVSHCIWFGQRGTDIPDIYIGLFGGTHEISFCGKNEKWKYEVDLSKFLDDAEQIFEAVQ
jgi:hypothetical protein